MCARVKLVENHLTSQLFSMRYRHAVHCIVNVWLHNDLHAFNCEDAFQSLCLGFFVIIPQCVVYCRWNAVVLCSWKLNYSRCKSVCRCHTLNDTCCVCQLARHPRAMQPHYHCYTRYLTAIWSGTSFSELNFRLMHEIMIFRATDACLVFIRNECFFSLNLQNPILIAKRT